MRRLIWVLILFFLVSVLAPMGLATPAVAGKRSPPVGRIVTQSTKVLIEGNLEDGDLTSSFRLRAAVASVPASDYYFFMGDLRGVSGTTGSVGRQHVKLPDPLDLPAGGRRNFTVAVTGLTSPGVYTGILKVIRIARPRPPPATIILEVRATRRPDPRVIGSTPVKLTATKPIVPSLDTWLGPLFGYAEQATVQLDNPVTAQLPVRNGEANLRRDFDGRSPTIKLGPDEHRSLSQWNAATDRTLVVSVRPTREEPGRYTGDILIRLADIDTRFAIPTELNIKYGPLLPLGVLVASLLLGIILRRLVSSFSAKRRTDKSKRALSRRINDLQQEVGGVAAAATGLPDPQEPQEPSRIRDSTEEVVKAATENFDPKNPDRTRGIPTILRIEVVNEDQSDKATKGDAQNVARRVAEQLVAQLAWARRLVAAGAFAEATKICDSVTETVNTLQRMRDSWNDFCRIGEPELNEPARAEGKRLMGEALWQWSMGQLLAANVTLDRLEARRWTWKRDPKFVDVAPPPLQPELRPEDFTRAEFAFLGPGRTALLEVVRPLFTGAATAVFYLALIVVLAVTALELFYFNNDTFGARLTDWFLLAGWGLATDPVSSALTKLRASPASA